VGFFFNLNISKKVSVFYSVVASAIQLVSKAKKPLMILGSQSTLPPIAADKLRSALEVQT
jgi:CO dehydrogenase/acetyl-CoA synthase epsilon subunit